MLSCVSVEWRGRSMPTTRCHSAMALLRSRAPSSLQLMLLIAVKKHRTPRACGWSQRRARTSISWRQLPAGARSTIPWVGWHPWHLSIRQRHRQFMSCVWRSCVILTIGIAWPEYEHHYALETFVTMRYINLHLPLPFYHYHYTIFTYAIT